MKKLLITLLVLISGICQAQIPDIFADRPGMSTPPSIMLPKYFQLETGLSYDKDLQYNSTMLRYGINNNSEIRAQINYIKTDSLTGIGPLTLGTKLKIVDGKGIIPTTSFMCNLVFPNFGVLKPSYVAPSMYLLFQNNITDKLSLGYNAGLEYYGENAQPFEFVSVVVGYNVTDKLNIFVENYNWFSTNSPQNYVDFGGSYILNKNLQVDISMNLDLHDINKYYAIQSGISWRFKK